MQVDQDSWLVTAEVILKATAGEDLPPLLVRVTSVPTSAVVPRLVGDMDEDTAAIIENLLPNVRQWPLTTSPASNTLLFFARGSIFRGLDWPEGQPRPDLVELLAEQVRIPVFGSPPNDWQTMGTAISGGSLTAGAIVTSGGQSILAVLFGVGVTVVMNVIIPPSRALGHGLEYRISKALDVPIEGPTIEAASEPRAIQAPDKPGRSGSRNNRKSKNKRRKR